jgi:hypothetical protein
MLESYDNDNKNTSTAGIPNKRTCRFSNGTAGAPSRAPCDGRLDGYFTFLILFLFK